MPTPESRRDAKRRARDRITALNLARFILHANYDSYKEELPWDIIKADRKKCDLLVQAFVPHFAYDTLVESATGPLNNRTRLSRFEAASLALYAYHYPKKTAFAIVAKELEADPDSVLFAQSMGRLILRNATEPAIREIILS